MPTKTKADRLARKAAKDADERERRNRPVLPPRGQVVDLGNGFQGPAPGAFWPYSDPGESKEAVRPFAAAGLTPCPLLTVSAGGGHLWLSGASGKTYPIPDEARINAWMLRAYYDAFSESERDRATKRNGTKDSEAPAETRAARNAGVDDAGMPEER